MVYQQQGATSSSYTVNRPTYSHEQLAPQSAAPKANETLEPLRASHTLDDTAQATMAVLRALDVGDKLPLDPGLDQGSQVVPASLIAATRPTLASPTASAEVSTTTSQQYTTTVASAIDEVNALRARRGLPMFAEDASLTAVAYRKASIQAGRGVMGHPGGSMGGARYEGVGVGHQFISCYLYSNAGRVAGAATVIGRNGQKFHCLLIR